MIHHVPKSQVAQKIAEGWVVVGSPPPTLADEPRGRWGCLLALVPFVVLAVVLVGAWWYVRLRSEVSPLVLIPRVTRPTAVPTVKPREIIGGPGTYMCQMCEAEGGCHGFRPSARIAFGGGVTELLGWEQYAPDGPDTFTITASGPFGVDAVYRKCRRVG